MNAHDAAAHIRPSFALATMPADDRPVKDGGSVSHERAGDLIMEDIAGLPSGSELVTACPMAIVLPTVVHPFEHPRYSLRLASAVKKPA